MEARIDSDSCSDAYTPSSLATNWSIAGSSLSDSITFESSLTPINDYARLKEDSSSKSPLILRPPSPDADPCEITISFSQKHEIRQVYVRSTARIYEVYYATNFQSDNEYLCTVHCGIASRGEELLHITNDEVLSAYPKGPSEGLAGGNLSVRNLSTNEDGWVEVKVDESKALVSDSDPARVMQDFYEATAEITDANPCTSITLRLLSLHSKSCAYIDEVYVFADPVDSDGKETGRVENSTGSLLTMLVPSLLQLSKFTGINKANDAHTSYREERCKSLDAASKGNDSTDIATKLALEEKSHFVNHGEVKVDLVSSAKIDLQPSTSEHGSPAFARIESTLGQLVSRIDRMENFFSRLEENMVKPINSIEARLQRVEQQLEVLTKKAQSSTLPYCSRIIAPDFSCTGSDSNSFCVDQNDHPSYGSFEAEKMELDVDLPVLAHTHMLPTLVVSAPEFSTGDDEEENDAIKSENDKPIMSIDDALASALTGFIVSTSVQTSKNTQAPTIIATEFSNDVNISVRASSIDQSEIAKDGLENFADLDHDFQVAGSDCALSLADEQIAEGAEESKRTEFETCCDLDLDKVNLNPPSEIDDESDPAKTEPTELTKEGSEIDIVHNVLGFAPCSSLVDFEYPLLDVKFIHLGNSCSNLSLEGLFADLSESYGETTCNDEIKDDSRCPPGEPYNSILVGEQLSIGPITDGHFSVDLDYCKIIDEVPEPDRDLGGCSTNIGEPYVSLI